MAKQEEHRILITGGEGQLGRALAHHYATAGTVHIAPGRAALDVTNQDSIARAIAQFQPTRIIHAAAATDVDRCEREPAWAEALNTTATSLISAAAREAGVPLVYISTNYVFDGRKPAGSAYTEDDQTNPLSVYGRTKLAGEAAVRATVPEHQIIRTAQVYAAQGRKFVQVMLRLAAEGRTTVQGVADQWVQPTYASDLAAGVAALANTAAWGTYHLTNSGSCTWADWASEIYRLRGLTVVVEPIPAATFRRDATPPTNGVMVNRHASNLGIALPAWQDGLGRCLAAMPATPPQ